LEEILGKKYAWGAAGQGDPVIEQAIRKEGKR
jgi:hypothetical protein